MYEKEIMQGDNEKNINPGDKITRAEISTLLDKAFNYIEDNNILPDLEEYKPTTTVSGMITEVQINKTESYIYVKNDSEVESLSLIHI